MFTVYEDGVDYGSFETLDLAIKSLRLKSDAMLKMVQPNVWTIDGYTIVKSITLDDLSKPVNEFNVRNPEFGKPYKIITSCIRWK